MRSCVFLLVCAALCLPGCGEAGRKEPVRLRLATTTSTDNSGLLDELLPPFERRENIDVQVIAVGTGRALALGERGDADVVLVHARRREDAFVAAGHGVERHDVMWNDFVILGPPADPARVRGLDDAAAALRRIRAARARFVSRGDDSGTHIRERELWRDAGGVPRGEAFYLEAGQSMGNCLVMADEKRAYVLADRGTFLAYRRKLDLEVLVEGDAKLRNPYGVMLVNPVRHPHVQVRAARALIEYLVSPEGQRRIGAYRVDGEVLFHPVRAGD